MRQREGAAGPSRKRRVLNPSHSDDFVNSPAGGELPILPLSPKSEFVLCRDQFLKAWGLLYVCLGEDLEDTDHTETVPAFSSCFERLPEISSDEVRRALHALSIIIAKLEDDAPSRSGLLGIKFSLTTVSRSLLQVNNAIVDTKTSLQELQLREVDLRHQYSLSYSFEDLFRTTAPSLPAIPARKREKHMIKAAHDYFSYHQPQKEELEAKLAKLEAEQASLVGKFQEWVYDVKSWLLPSVLGQEEKGKESTGKGKEKV